MSEPLPDTARELLLAAPKGFRPSDWVERLMNFDELESLGVDLVYPKYTANGQVLVVRTELLDPKGGPGRGIVWSQIMSFARINGLTVTLDAALGAVRPDEYVRVKEALSAAGVHVVESGA